MCAFRHFAQRAFWAARILAMAADDIFLFVLERFGADPDFCALTRAQRARCAAAMRARPAALIPPPVLVAEPVRCKAAIARWMLCSWD